MTSSENPDIGPDDGDEMTELGKGFADMSIAITHGNYFADGGGERVANELARAFDAPLYYGFGNPDHVPDDIEAYSLANDSFLSPLSGMKVIRDPYYFWNFRYIPELAGYDIIIQSGNEFGWFVPRDEQVVIRYLHSTPRTPYDRFQDKGGALKESLYSEVARLLYAATVPYPDLIVANSERVRRRAFRYWDKREDVRVVYPPVDIDGFYHADTEDYYLTIGRLWPEKQIHEMIRAFNRHPDKRLIIAGTGSDKYEKRLRRMAGPNVDFRGYVSEQTKYELFANATATLFSAVNEDFGLVPIEAFASGCPVIGIRDGFTQYQIQDELNGILYERGADNLSAAISRFEREGVACDPEDLMALAEQYSTERFREGMREVVREAVDMVQLHPKSTRFVSDIASEAPVESHPHVTTADSEDEVTTRVGGGAEDE